MTQIGWWDDHDCRNTIVFWPGKMDEDKKEKMNNLTEDLRFNYDECVLNSKFLLI